MPRQYRPLSDHIPGIRNDQLGAMISDFAAQVVEQTMVAGSPGGVNVVLNSLRSTNVHFYGYSAMGISHQYYLYEVTSPTVSAVVLGIGLVNGTGQADNANLFIKGMLLQKQQDS